MRSVFQSDKLHDECGVFGMFAGSADTSMAYYALLALQHRGQESAGLAAFSGDGRLISYKDTGLVSAVFDDARLAKFAKKKLILGHVRYATSGTRSAINAQPMCARTYFGNVAMAYNGTVVNADRLRRELIKDGSVFMTDVDSEIFVHLFARYSHLGVEKAIHAIMRDVQGSFSMVLMLKDKLVAVRDPFGIRPLCLGKMGDSYFVASESSAFNATGVELVRDVEPGEIVIIDKDGFHSVPCPDEFRRDKKVCIFEYVYFARTDSTIDTISVHSARLRAGRALSHVAPVEADLVAPVPDSAMGAALGYARESGIKFGEALVKNRYIGRTFIQPSQVMREIAVSIKLNALVSGIVANRRIILVDDSIVRGTTSRNLVDMLRAAGAQEVHLRISSPPVRHPCYLGVDTPSPKELISTTNSVEEIRKRVGADSLAYLPLEELVRATPYHEACGFCTGCFNSEYPMDIEKCKRMGLCPANGRKK